MRLKMYLKYHARWQLSTVVMLVLMYPLETYLNLPVYINLPLGQLFGATIFWYIDNWIFKNSILEKGELWQISETQPCCVCEKVGYNFRLVNIEHMYNKIKDPKPKFRCFEHAIEKYKNILKQTKE